jgi:hypothetical protein
MYLYSIPETTLIIYGISIEPVADLEGACENVNILVFSLCLSINKNESYVFNE